MAMRTCPPGDLQDTMTAFDEVLHDTASIADEVAAEVGERLQRLRGQLFTHILQVGQPCLRYPSWPTSLCAALRDVIC